MSRIRAHRPLLVIVAALAGLGATAPAIAQEPTAQARTPATAEQRAAYSRLDPLARSVFWSREAEIDPADPVAGDRSHAR